MDISEIIFSAKTLLFKISAITGWTLPISEMLTVLIDQFSKTLAEKYRFTNINEFEYAFRSKGIETKDWGKSLNLSLIDEIMIPYLETRIEVSKMEESKKSTQNLLPKRKREMTNEEWEEWIIDIRKYTLEAIPNMVYEYLERVGKINFTNIQKHGFMSEAINHLMVKLEGRDALEFVAMKNKGKFEGKFLASLQTIAKKIAVKNYFYETDL